MAVAAEYGQLSSSHAYAPLEGRFEVIKEIGDGSFGNVVLARVRAAGATVARRGTMVSFPFGQ
jgi:meiosis induction protein kinase IME2/SME1